MKFVHTFLVGSLALLCYGQDTQVAMPDMLPATLVKILSTRDPAMFEQNRAQTLTVINTGETIEIVLRALAPTLKYTFYSINEEGMSRMDPSQYWTQVLLVVLEETEYLMKLDALFSQYVWLRPQHLILAITVESPAINLRISDYMNSWFSTKKIYNVIFVYHVQGRVEIFASEPFLPSEPSDRSQFSKYTDLFYDKTQNLHGRKLSVLLLPDMPRVFIQDGTYSGIDGEHMKILFNKINANYRVATTPDDVQGFDIVFNMLPINWTTQSHTYMYEIEEFCFIVKREPRQYMVADMVTLFQFSTWCVIFTIFCISGSLWYFYHANNRVTMSDTFYFMFEAQVQLSIHQRARTWFENVFIFSYSIYAFLIIEMVRARIYALLIAPGIEDYVTTIAEVLSANDEIYTPKWVYESMKHLHGSDFMRPFRTFERESLFKYNTTATAFLLPRWDAQQIVRQHQNNYELGDKMWYVVKECLQGLPRAYSLEPSSPFVAVFNKYMLQMRETGVVQALEQQNHWPAVGSPLSFEKTSYGVSVRQFYGGFFLLATGFGTATVIFVLENVIGRIRNWWRRRQWDRLPMFGYIE